MVTLFFVSCNLHFKTNCCFLLRVAFKFLLPRFSPMSQEDLALALRLQAEFDSEISSFLPVQSSSSSALDSSPLESSLIAPEWEDVDPTPDLHALFLQYNDRFFAGKLSSCEVKWSPRMTLCAGLCSYQKRARYCSIR